MSVNVERGQGRGAMDIGGASNGGAGNGEAFDAAIEAASGQGAAGGIDASLFDTNGNGKINPAELRKGLEASGLLAQLGLAEGNGAQLQQILRDLAAQTGSNNRQISVEALQALLSQLGGQQA